MRTDKIGDKSKKVKDSIVGVQKTEKSSCTKPSDYYYKRALARSEQTGETVPNLTSNEIFEMQKSNLNSEKNRVREFKKQFSEKIGHVAYEKNLENTAEMQERKYREQDKEDNEKCD